MKKAVIYTLISMLCYSCSNQPQLKDKEIELAERILQDTLMMEVEKMALAVVQGGFNAGDGYGEVWIRDYNTFIELAMEVMPDREIQENLLTFFHFQGETGDIVDGFIPVEKAATGYNYRYSHSEPRYAAHKNTVETDQESSLIQAVWRYISKSGNREFLNREIEGKTVLERMEMALHFLLNERYDQQYGLLWGATTADWGDVQPEHPWGVELDENSHLCIDIYDNAFFIIAINCYLDLQDNHQKQAFWREVRDQFSERVRNYLWDEEREKFIPHLYLNGSPFPETFNEEEIYYHGGTAMAIEAGLLTREEVEVSNKAMMRNVDESGAPSIGLTLYPTYPEGFFQNKGMYPYGYQNGGDWTWFGGRMIRQLIRYGFVEEAYEEIQPMLERVVRNNGFYEWYALDGTPSGSGSFRGEAGVLFKAIEDFRSWAEGVVKPDRKEQLPSTGKRGLIPKLADRLKGRSRSNLRYVDPAIGGVGIILEPTRPVVHLPNSMVRVFPQRRDQLDDQIHNFPLSLVSHRRQLAFAFMPVSGGTSPERWSLRYTWFDEKLTPYYYSTSFEETGDRVEFAPQSRSGYFRIHFKEEVDHYLRFGIFNGKGEISVDNAGAFSGFEEIEGIRIFFYGVTDAAIVTREYLNSADKMWLLAGIGRESKQVAFKYGISFISIDQAKSNLLREIPDWDFGKVKENAYAVWDRRLSQIKVKGGTEAQKRVFYTALYRSYERMVDINEYGHYYSAYDNKVHPSDTPFYVDNWIWDTYIALEPLHMILNPEREVDQINSYIEMYRQGGYIPSFALVTGDWPAMTGNFAAAWIADAWFKGLRNFDLKTAYEGLRKNSLDATLIPWRNGPKTILDDFYNENGYMPGLAPGEKESVAAVDTVWEKRQSVSVTTANSYSDWCIAQLASELNLTEEAALFTERSANYKNLFRTDKGFMWPKDSRGEWIEPYDPRFAGREYFTENNAYIYNWDVKHDLEGLFGLMGGPKAAEEKLDQLFREDLGLPKFRFWYTQPDASGLVGQFVMGNEPGLHIPYLYNYLGAPWKSQKRIRMLMESFFMDNIFGIPGDEDGGAMSAYVVLSMMGFFQVTPGIPVYTLGSPVFSEISIDLPNGKLFKVIARNNSDKNIYIQRASMNGKPLNTPWFTHDQIVDGSTLVLEMGELPNKEWGAQKGYPIAK
ncbi:alpha-1,2-mannosidase, putative [Porphyromonadaceae bacterium KHP3R9]|nr:alpha-1,2-mannosidase, putative [Porphyromonadaceae bacterium KHP3R9]